MSKMIEVAPSKHAGGIGKKLLARVLTVVAALPVMWLVGGCSTRTTSFENLTDVNGLTGWSASRLELTSYAKGAGEGTGIFSRSLTIGVRCSDSTVLSVYVRGDVGDIPYSSDWQSYQFTLADGVSQVQVLRTQYDSINNRYYQKGLKDSTFIRLLLSPIPVGLGWWKQETVHQYRFPDDANRQAFREQYREHCARRADPEGYVPPP